MAATTAVKSGPTEGGKVQFRTQMVNGKPQIYFDALDESPTKPKAKRTSNRLPEQPTIKPKAPSQKSSLHNVSNKQTKKTPKVTFTDEQSKAGVFMTMDEISELVKAVKETTIAQNNTTAQNQEPPPPEQRQAYEVVPVVVVPKSDKPAELAAPPLAPISPRQEALGMMADKKRQKWMREKAEMDRMKLEVEYDQLKHQLSPVHQKSALSPERPTFPQDYSSMNRPPLPPSSMKQNENSSNDLSKTRLMEKKQQQWKQENADKSPFWNPFGRPGAGAPNTNEIQTNYSQPPSNIVMPYRPPDTSSIPTQIVLNDQTRVPAAMRTNLLFGDVRFEDDVKSAKELERRQWLDDLQRQIEENKRQKSQQQETERRQDFLQENVQPLVQEAANRHQQQQQQQQTLPPPPPPPQQKDPSPSSNPSTQDGHKSKRHDSIVQQTYDKIVEATELAKYEKKAQLIEKLKRNGHKTDLLAKTLPNGKNATTTTTATASVVPATSQKTHDSSPQRSTKTKIEPLNFDVGNDHEQSHRTNDARRDEAVNTIDSTFRSDNSVQTDPRMAPYKQLFSFNREESDLPPQIPSHLLRQTKGNKKNVRIRSLEDHQRQRRSSTTTAMNDDGQTSQLGTQRSNYAPVDLVHRPLWNYQNPEHREYVPNSKRDPNYSKTQRSKPPEATHVDRPDDSQKKTTYSRWNSDSELQSEKKVPLTNRTRSTASKTNHPKEEHLVKREARHDAFTITNPHDQANFNNISSLDKYEHFTPYIRTDEVLDPARAFSPVPQSRETSAHRQRTTTTYDDQQRRQNISVQPPPYHVPPSRQQHILQQLTAIKENLVRRQQEVTTSMNAIPV